MIHPNSLEVQAAEIPTPSNHLSAPASNLLTAEVLIRDESSANSMTLQATPSPSPSPSPSPGPRREVISGGLSPLSSPRSSLRSRESASSLGSSRGFEGTTNVGGAGSTSNLSSFSTRSVGRESYRRYKGPRPNRHAFPPGMDTPPRADLAVPHTPLTAPPLRSVARPSTPGPRFAPIVPSMLLRYDRPSHTSHLRDPSKGGTLIKALTFKYPTDDPRIPIGWSKHVHPEGSRYYLHEASNTYTEMDICDAEILGDVEYYREFLLDPTGLGPSQLDLKQVELVIEPQGDDEGVLCRYYFVNHVERCLFWVDDLPADSLLGDYKGFNSLSHQKLGVEAEYWLHWHRFPNLCVVTEKLVKELKYPLLYCSLSQLTESRGLGSFTVTSAVASTLDQLKNYTSLVNDIDARDEAHHHLSAAIIGRIMHYFYRERYINFHGEDCARLHYDQTVHGWRYQPSIFMAFFAPVLFLTPMKNVQSLHKLYVDGVTRVDKWSTFVNDFTSQLMNTNLLATVLLTTNVGFLAIQSVDSNTTRTPQQIASYMSLVSSLASIVLGLVFLERNRHDRPSGASGPANFLKRFHHPKHGLEALAFIFSLPLAYLMWGIVFFFAAFSIECYRVGSTAARGSMGGLIILLCAPAIVALWLSRELMSHWWWQADPDQIVFENTVEDMENEKPSFTSRLLATWGCGAPERQDVEMFPLDNILAVGPGNQNATEIRRSPGIFIQRPTGDDALTRPASELEGRHRWIPEDSGHLAERSPMQTTEPLPSSAAYA
ncbi:hypothetical protein HYDPIDRAFT_115736 [Hydnomerulius pinastri MD-312]|uniref:Uncharacterized protein n=1 Tax=Hydnomerulius pinastri MD-312 TaxID=994086 RepID=A0A0C9V7D7_9AGAM|nr:hypothetical protein HYDPIDRAFT_115736 [Hydnomerulius pinastri MD-312]